MRKTLTSRPDVPAEVLRRIAAAALSQNRTENFPVALRFLPREPRNHLLRVYTYARFVDDIGDRAPGDRLALLDLVADDVARLPAGRAQLGPVAGLQPLVPAHGLTVEPLLDLITANRIDQTQPRYESFDDLLGYCAKSAAPVGRMVLVIAGVRNEAAVARSDAVCAALQVLEHCQDVREDALAGRVYLPADDLRAAGVGDADLTAHVTAPGLRRVVGMQVERAERLLDAGGALVRSLRGWARFAVAGYVAGGRATAHALRAADYDVLGRAISPTKARTGVELGRLLMARAGR
jgi:squalene synthase HpnC